MAVKITENLKAKRVSDYPAPISSTAETFADTSNYYSWDNCPLTWDGATKSWDMAGYIVYRLEATETLAIAEWLGKEIAVTRREALRLKEAFGKGLVLKVAEKLGFAETYWDNIKFYLHVCENLGISESSWRHTGKNEEERFRLGETQYKNLAKNVKESIAFKEELKRHAVYGLAFYETVRIVEWANRHPTLQKQEAFGLTDHIAKAMELLKKENVGIVDELRRQYKAQRTFNETLSVSDFLAKAIVSNQKEAIALYDTILRACEGVLSNIYAEHGELSLEDFLKAVDTPSGYTNFMDFKVGEYEYQEALVRILIKASVPQSEPSVSDVVIHVDIPDTDDRGTVEIEDTTAPTKVYYNKFYYNPPEVSAIVIGGNTGDGVLRPNLIRTDGLDDRGRFFEVEIIASDGTRTTGLISWVSKGY